MTVRPEINELQRRMALEIVGQEQIIESLVVGILANGNILVEGLPGLAKTRAIKALSNNIEGDFSRIQFTPDLVSSDITGREVFYPAEGDGKGVFKFIKGPIFSNVVLADEINRAPAKAQNALLEAMEERQVTVAGVTHKVPELFMVMATQNPAGQEGTFPLPEAQMDRFLMHISVDYPDEEAEANIIRMVREEMSQKKKNVVKTKTDQVRTSQATIFAARDEIDRIPVPRVVEDYMVDLIFATRYPQRYTYELKSYIRIGASPRASLALDRCVRAHAWLRGQEEVKIENVKAMIKSVLRHRIMRAERALEHNISSDEIISDILCLVKTPR
jgi:MoxR-like ATPase